MYSQRQSNSKKSAKYADGDNDDSDEEVVSVPIAEVVSLEDFLQSKPKKSRKQTKSPSSPKKISEDASLQERKPQLLERKQSMRHAKCWPPPLIAKIKEALGRPIDETAGRRFMTDNLWPLGLQNTLIKSVKKFPIRFFIVDDSGRVNCKDFFLET